MKKNFYIAIFCVYVFTSCSKDLDQTPISAATSETFYATRIDFLQGIYSVYNSLRGYPDRQFYLSETRSDNIYGVSDGGVWAWEGINDFHKTIASNQYISEAYTSDFNGIYKANVLLDKLQANGTVIGDAVLQKRLEAEAKFLRAFYYFDLIRWFGKVPLIDHPVSSAEALNIGRSPVSDVYNLVISDLKFAADNLLDVYPDVDKGRVTKSAAKGILALVYMTRSGPTYGIDGPGLASNEWNLALPLLNDVLANPRYSFLPSYSSIFSYNNENNAEVILDVEFKAGSNPLLGSGFSAALVPATYFRSLSLVDQVGIFIRPVSNNLANSYEAGDIRKPFTILTTGYTYNGLLENRPFYIKYLDVTKQPAVANDWPINFIVLRYTDVLLLKAECVLHGAPGSQTTDVDAVVNKIRVRAGLSGQKANITLPQLFEERRKELAGEGFRWHDLVRSGLIETIIPAWIAADDIKHQIQPFEKNFIIYPIPQAEMDVKQDFYTQNAGY